MSSFKLGLIKPGAVAGLGGIGVYGLAQYILNYHYSNTYYCSLAFHELGHCMGYGHSSSFTYGPWAESVMNHFYVNNIHRGSRLIRGNTCDPEKIRICIIHNK